MARNMTPKEIYNYLKGKVINGYYNGLKEINGDDIDEDDEDDDEEQTADN